MISVMIRLVRTIILNIDNGSVRKHSLVIWWKDMEAGVHRGREDDDPTGKPHDTRHNTSRT